MTGRPRVLATPRSAPGDQGHHGQDRDQEKKRVDSDSANHSEDQQNGSNRKKHAHLRIGFPELTRGGGSGPGRRFRQDVRIQTTPDRFESKSRYQASIQPAHPPTGRERRVVGET